MDKLKNDLSLDEISERIIDAVLEERFINKETLSIIIRPLLKIWLKQTDSCKSNKASVSQLQRTIESRGIERSFWLHKIRDILTPEQMQPLYDELSQKLIESGYKKPTN